MKGRNMTRWRDPAKDPRQEPKSNLITLEGAERLRGILDHLSRVKRPQRERQPAVTSMLMRNSLHWITGRKTSAFLDRLPLSPPRP